MSSIIAEKKKNLMKKCQLSSVTAFYLGLQPPCQKILFIMCFAMIELCIQSQT